jgi:hypothetical protein
MRHVVVVLGFLVTLAAVAVGCGFGRADDTGRPIPGNYWGWTTPDAGADADASLDAPGP